MKKVLLLVIFLVSFCFVVPDIKASGASLYLSPNSGTFEVGSTFDVSILVNTDQENVNTIQADLKFNSKEIQVVNSAVKRSFISLWTSSPSYSNANGLLSFQGGIPSPGINTSSGLISTITFRTIKPGETSIYFLDTAKILLDDGQGTNVLSSTGRGIYNITVLSLEGPVVFSLTHPDQNKWYKDNNPTISWEKNDGITDYSYSIDFDSQSIPDNKSEGDKNTVSLPDLGDGIWYFHIKAKKNDIWGGTSHYVVRIDKSYPAHFIVETSPFEKTTFSKPILFFTADDSLSGFDHFEIKIIDITLDHKNKSDSFFIEVVSPYQLPDLEIGTYLVVIRAYDKAGNWRDENIKIEIISEKTSITKKGLWYEGKFVSWWPFLLVILILIILILIISIVFHKRDKVRKIKIARKLKRKKGEIKKKMK